MESGDELSLETTVPTDLSGSLDELTSPDEKKHKIGRHLYERKQLLHDIQVLKIELSQKSLMLDNMKVEHMRTVEELDEKLNDAVYEKRQLQARLESQLKIQQDDARRRTERIQKELDTILKRQHQLEKTNEILQERAADIRKDLKNLELTENQYHELKLKEEDDLAIKDYVGIKLYEAVRPWKIENGGLKTRCKSLSDDLHNCKRALEKYQDELESLTCQHKDLESKYQRLSLTYAECKAEVQHGHYKIENFDKIKEERDEFDRELTDLKKQFAYLDATHEMITKERDNLSAEVVSLKQKVSLLEKDKDFFSKQVSDLQNKLLYNEDKVIQLGEQLERAKASREELYDKYVASRGLHEARNMALAERDRAQAGERDANAKSDQILQE
ncbi:hypothetical protein LSH36_38g01046 [Paralvinella palmiformis]|uniref:Progesterone-induced-blocking factor 1 n=1 Tax=Paralvinella palmiformis TaxID=53620 RepID=A0AAD9K7S4_9ANNE|nr:hypothetical protein LSH36_38g01046 [Paralvinella palmiformis]